MRCVFQQYAISEIASVFVIRSRYCAFVVQDCLRIHTKNELASFI